LLFESFVLMALVVRMLRAVPFASTIGVGAGAGVGVGVGVGVSVGLGLLSGTLTGDASDLGFNAGLGSQLHFLKALAWPVTPQIPGCSLNRLC
jgi:hypothetical protein